MAYNMPKYEFREGRVNKGHPGILVISDKFEFLYNKANKEKTISYYYCKLGRTKGIVCPAKASLVKYIGEEGETKFLLKTWSEEHTHPGCMAGSVAEGMKLEMCQLVKVYIYIVTYCHIFPDLHLVTRFYIYFNCRPILMSQFLLQE